MTTKTQLENQEPIWPWLIKLLQAGADMSQGDHRALMSKLKLHYEALRHLHTLSKGAGSISFEHGVFNANIRVEITFETEVAPEGMPESRRAQLRAVGFTNTEIDALDS